MRSFGLVHMGDRSEEQNNPLGSLGDFLDKERFESRFSQAMEALANEERIATGYGKEAPKSALKTNKRRCIFIIITETQAIQESMEKMAFSSSNRNSLANASAIRKEQMREQKELMETHRERLLRSILDELEEISYNRSSRTYKDRIAELPPVKKSSKVPEAMGCFHSKDGIVQSIRVASEKIDRTSIGSISRYSGVVKDVIDALGTHSRLVNEQLGQRAPGKTKVQSKEGTPRYGVEQTVQQSRGKVGMVVLGIW